MDNPTDEPARPAGLAWKREFTQFAIPGSMRLLSPTRAVFERHDHRPVGFLPLGAGEPPHWCRELRRDQRAAGA